MPSSTLLILDFDRTLFNPVFYYAMIKLMVRHGLLSATAAQPIFDTLNNPNYTIDLLATLSHHGIDQATALRLAKAEFAPDQFLYPDAVNFLKRAHGVEIIILTTATGRTWQQFKLSLCPSLNAFPQIVISGNKGEYIKGHLRRHGGQISLINLDKMQFNGIILIDDRINALTPLMGESGVALWHIQRPDAKYPREHDFAGINYVTSLNEVQIP